MNKKSSIQKNTNININTGQYLIGLIIISWVISWYFGLINQQNINLYTALLGFILLASIFFIFKVKKILKLIWITISIIIILLLYVIYRFNSNGFGQY
ncbi:hypothetical protein A3F64_01095 [Candidatus Saccharibacteria bacterium RIFCSPHIGHO2_12_FULL_42_8]|nr:MAG: hypothetical protein A3F64_01095 [Candidatus Saccharibacteria bacterium RIFCSPHIGHO2_12_FULL_42_8]